MRNMWGSEDMWEFGKSEIIGWVGFWFGDRKYEWRVNGDGPVYKIWDQVQIYMYTTSNTKHMTFYFIISIQILHRQSNMY